MNRAHVVAVHVRGAHDNITALNYVEACMRFANLFRSMLRTFGVAVEDEITWFTDGVDQE